MKKTLTVFLLLFSFFSTSAQIIEKTISISSFNGKNDTTIYEYEWGPWSKVWSLEHTSPHKGISLFIEGVHSFNSTWDFLTLSSAWLDTNAYGVYPYIKLLTKHAVPDLAPQADPSLLWLLEAYNNRVNIDDSLIAWKTSFETRWIDDTLKIPDNYSILSDYGAINNIDDSINYEKLLISYIPNAHLFLMNLHPDKMNSPFLKLNTTTYGTIYTTGNGLVLKKGNKYRWIYIHDYRSTDYRGKMRWATLDSVLTEKEWVIFSTYTPVDFKLYIINLESSNLYLIPEEVLDKVGTGDWGREWDLKIIKNNVVFSSEVEKLTIPLSKFK